MKVANLAGHLLGRVAQDGPRLYQHAVYGLETFLDPERFSGTCYRAANWIYLGQTTGRGHHDQTHRPNRSFRPRSTSCKGSATSSTANCSLNPVVRFLLRR